MSRSVAIVGKAPTASLAPFDDENWEIWGLAWTALPRMTRLFDIHEPGFKGSDDLAWHFNSHRNPEYFRRVNHDKPRAGVPVWCAKGVAGKGDHQFHYGVEYPLEEVLAELPRCYLDCTVAYMVALAIHEGVDRIGIWGCNFLGRAEFRIQMPSVTWLLGFAEGRGIEVVLSPGQTLMVSGYTAGRYGVDQKHRFQWQVQ